MWGFVARRLLLSTLVLAGASVVVFFIVRLSGDPVALLLPMDAGPEVQAALRERLGLDDPLLVQYGHFAGNLLRGDFGDSLRHRQPAIDLVVERLPATFELATAALLLACLVGIPLGILAAVRRGTLIEVVAMLVTLTGQAVPGFWLGLMLIMIVGVQWQLLPTFGRGGLAHLVLPAITLSAYTTAILVRILRSSMLEVLSADYVRTAYAKGLRPQTVVVRHALRNALIGLVTVLGLQFATLMGGAVVTEAVFAWPGVGRLAVQAIYNRDYPVVQAVVMTVVVIFVLVNLVVDVLYAWIDPRIQY
jgi:ABC-type dipeptide/oligopeptide/nickel transport system permease component